MMVYLVVLAFIGFDILTGFMKAFYKEGIKSTVLRKGLFHKLSEIVSVAGASLFEYGAEYINLGVDVPLLKCVVGYICVMELISILENISEINPTLGRLFKPYIEKMKDKDGENE